MVGSVSGINVSSLQKYLRIAEITDDDVNYLQTILNVAKDFIKNTTGMDNDTMDSYSDLIICVYVLCQDMYDNRSYYVDNNNVNKVAQSILDMHARNLL